ncbi:hypothetical protein VTO42DRAFT_3682 [Malbranchea cinnamomea]
MLNSALTEGIKELAGWYIRLRLFISYQRLKHRQFEYLVTQKDISQQGRLLSLERNWNSRREQNCLLGCWGKVKIFSFKRPFLVWLAFNTRNLPLAKLELNYTKAPKAVVAQGQEEGGKELGIIFMSLFTSLFTQRSRNQIALRARTRRTFNRNGPK